MKPQTFLGIFLLLGVLISFPENGNSADTRVTITSGYGAAEPGPYGPYGMANTNGTIFSITRITPDSKTNSALTVYLSVSGTAQRLFPGDINLCPQVADYKFGYEVHEDAPIGIPNFEAVGRSFVSIPAGVNTLEIPIWPLLDFDCEPTETVTLTLLPSVEYDLLDPDGFATSNATVQIFNNPTASAVHDIPSGQRISQGNMFTFRIWRDCGCIQGTDLWGTPITNEWVLKGTALYGTDYTINSTVDHTVSNEKLYVTIPRSNEWVEIEFTALLTNSFTGTKTVDLVHPDFLPGYSNCPSPRSPDITILAAGTPFLHSETMNTNGMFQFLISAPTTNLCYISVSTNLVDWTNIGTVFMTNDTNIFFDSQTSNFVNRFYRVQYSP